MTCSHDDFQTARSVLCLDNTELGFSNNRAGYRSYDAEKCPEQNAGPGDYITKSLLGIWKEMISYTFLGGKRRGRRVFPICEILLYRLFIFVRYLNVLFIHELCKTESLDLLGN